MVRRGLIGQKNHFFADNPNSLPDVIHHRVTQMPASPNPGEDREKLSSKNGSASLLWPKLLFKFQCQVDREKYATRRGMLNLIIFQTVLLPIICVISEANRCSGIEGSEVIKAHWSGFWQTLNILVGRLMFC